MTAHAETTLWQVWFLAWLLNHEGYVPHVAVVDSLDLPLPNGEPQPPTAKEILEVLSGRCDALRQCSEQLGEGPFDFWAMILPDGEVLLQHVDQPSPQNSSLRPCSQAIRLPKLPFEPGRLIHVRFSLTSSSGACDLEVGASPTDVP